MLARELAERSDLGFVRQIRDDGPVGLEAPQDIRTHQRAKRRVRVLRLRREAFRKCRECLPGSQEARIDEVEDRPQIAKAVLDRCPAERDARLRIDLLGGPRLPGPRCLDRLRLVQDGEAPRHGEQCRHAQQRSVAGDHEVDIGNRVAIEGLHFCGGHR